MELIIRQQILTIMNRIAAEIRIPSTDSYTNQRELISRLFGSEKLTADKIYLRLVVIDSLYSTNASYSHFSFEEMADRIANLGTDADARRYFQALVSGVPDNIKSQKTRFTQKEGLFNEPYGIQKNLNDGSRQISLLSKYAYYVMLQDKANYPLGFPIYDSLAKLMFPKVWKALGLKNRPALTGDISIEDYVSAMGRLREAVFGKESGLVEGMQQFDILDAYLWRMGKFDKGNLSLLLSRDEYEIFVRNIGLKNYSPGKGASDFDSKVRESLSRGSEAFARFDGDRRDYLESLRRHWLQISE